jgi:hypothetical protein
MGSRARTGAKCGLLSLPGVRRAPLLPLVILVCALGACGGEDEREPTSAAGGAAAEDMEPRRAGDGGEGASASSEPASAAEPSPTAPDEAIEDRPGGPRDQAAVRLVRRYVEALDRRDGATVCRLISPAAMRRVALPRDRGGCAASVRASIGYRNPRGSPQWKGARVTGPPSVARASYGARLVVPLRIDFADRAYVSREDDVVYLRARGDGWVIAKPSAVFFRAIGSATVPPSVLAPPR